MHTTILISSFNPFIARNILSTDVFSLLRENSKLRLVIFCPDYKSEYFAKNFQGENVIIEGVLSERFDRQDIIFGYLSRSLLRTSSLSLHRLEIFLRNKNFILFLLSYLLSWLGYLLFVKNIVRRLDYLSISKDRFRPYFEKYNPDLVFASDIFHIDDVHLLAEAKSRNIKTIGMIRSWDNVTNKGLFRVKPDKVIVNGQVIKNEVVKYQDIEKDNVWIGRMPQFDCYINHPYRGRDKFFKAACLDLGKKTVLFALLGNRFYDSDWRFLQFFKEAIESGELNGVQFLVRLPPNDNVHLGDFIPDNNFHIDKPGYQFKEGVFRDREMNEEEMLYLADSLYYSDLIVGYSTTFFIDGAVFDKPVIAIGFDLDKKAYLESARRFLDYTHMNKFLTRGSVEIAKNKDDLLRLIKFSLQHPEVHKKERIEVLKDYAGKVDGNSGRRIADFILHYLNS